jgi:hypothetical protein
MDRHYCTLDQTGSPESDLLRLQRSVFSGICHEMTPNFMVGVRYVRRVRQTQVDCTVCFIAHAPDWVQMPDGLAQNVACGRRTC